MRKYLLCILGLIPLCARAAFAQPSAPVPDWLADPQLQITALPDLLNADSIQTDLGALRIVIAADHGQLLYQYDEKPIQSIQLPTALQQDYGTNDIAVAPDGLAAVICHIDNIDMGYMGTAFTVDLSQRQITQANPCQLKNRWDLTQFGAWEVVSPDTQYRVSDEAGFPFCHNYDDSAIVVESQYGRRVSTCIQDDRLGQQVQFIRWLDDDRLLMKVISDNDGEDPTEESIILSASTGKTMSLGEDIGRVDPGLFFYDDHQKAARIDVKDENKSPNFNVDGPVDCALNLIDFDTNQTVDVEPSYCLHDPEIHINEQRRELLYINDHIPGDGAFTPVKTPHLVNIDTHSVTALPITGTLVDILGISPDWNQFAFLVDSDPQARSGTFWPIGAFSVMRYANPHFLIYDQRQKQIIYDKPLRHDHNPEDGSVDPLPFGVPSIEWTADGWQMVVRVEGETPLLVQEANGQVTEASINNLPLSGSYHVTWSPDKQKLLILLANYAEYVIDLKVNSAEPIIKPTGQSLSVDWDGDNQLLIKDASIKRWLITLPS